MGRLKMSVLTLFFVISFLVLTQNLEYVTATRPIHGSPITQKPPSTRLKVIKSSPSISAGFKINRYKKTETEAFRPTAPGRSPGAGHEEPPGSQ
ncbi:hypothetical protein RND81_06G208100 [Saponaria officinalis]|uniref:Transmembrane protein n=1 Tax=Saponaria officinalis TaxID=3572 RepID=A0AAW1K8S6_SAPOF